MSELNKSSYPENTASFKNDPLFYEELTILKAQETIAELMENSNTTKVELAKLLNQSKAHVTELLSDGRNLTLRTFARVCFHLKSEIDFQTYSLGIGYDEESTVNNKKLVSYQTTDTKMNLYNDWMSNFWNDQTFKQMQKGSISNQQNPVRAPYICDPLPIPEKLEAA